MRISAWLTLILFVLRCGIGWIEIKTSIESSYLLKCCYLLFGYAGEAIGIAAVLMCVFNNWAWRWGPINKVTGQMPIFSKRYKGTLSFEMNGVIQTRNSNLEIDQTFLNIKVRLRTNESASQVIRASVEEIHNEKQLLYMYINEPKAELRSKSPMHYGTAMLRVVSPEKISGNYYTDRLTRGSMEFTAE